MRKQGWPLQALLQVIAEQVKVVEDDIDQLYDNWFIETCQDWVVPYIGDLVGFQPVHEVGEPEALNTPQGRLRNKILAPRREVANTIRYRRRKGTLALFELLARQVAGWPAHAVEFYKRLAWTQNLHHLHRTADGPWTCTTASRSTNSVAHSIASPTPWTCAGRSRPTSQAATIFPASACSCGA